MNNADKPAFPTVKGEHDCQWKAGDIHGLTKREYFAAMAMHGIISAGKILGSDAIAETAIEHADELLKQLDL